MNCFVGYSVVAFTPRAIQKITVEKLYSQVYLYLM